MDAETRSSAPAVRAARHPVPHRPGPDRRRLERAAGGATLAAREPVRRQRARADRARRRRRRRRAPSAPPSARSTAPWGALDAAERGRVLAAIGRKVLEHVELLARLEALDVGKPLKQGRADAVALARYFEFYGGAADKVHGETMPFRTATPRCTLREPHGVTGHIVPWNYPMQIFGRSVGARARDGQRLRAEAGRGGLPDGARVRAHRRRGRAAGRRAQRRHRPRRGSRRGARRPSGHRPPVVHRLGRDRRAGPGGGRAQRRAGHARARRQVPADRLRRRRPRRGAAVPRQRRHPERRPDLLGGVAHPGRAAGVRRGARAHGGALPGAARRAGAAPTSTSAR